MPILTGAKTALPSAHEEDAFDFLAASGLPSGQRLRLVSRRAFPLAPGRRRIRDRCCPRHQ
jgi:hypothetical protein